MALVLNLTFQVSMGLWVILNGFFVGEMEWACSLFFGLSVIC